MDRQKVSISSLPFAKLAQAVDAMGLPGYRAGQIFGWLHNKGATAFSQMTNLPTQLRDKLDEAFVLDAPQVDRVQTSADGTEKYLLRLQDSNLIEAVLMQYKHGNTLCISSQVGCRMGCRFCASTQGGLVRSLTAGEMAGQVYAAQRASGRQVSNIVLMGIGEPLDNFDNVVDFLNIIVDEKGQNLSMRNISLSTCGLVPGIQRLAGLHLGLTLSVSLHAPNNAARSGMMPVNEAYPLETLLPACREYAKTTGRRVSFEYAMVRGVNDTQSDAKELARLLRGMNAHVNLIPVNPVDGSPYGASDVENIHAFQRHLESLGINATVRRRLGADIDAACGQLRQRAAREEHDEGQRQDGHRTQSPRKPG